MKPIYFDNNATTPLAPEVVLALRETGELFGNPSSIHWAGREARRILNFSREKMAALLGCLEREIIFTSGGTEGINAVLRQVFEERSKEKNQIITSPLEHQATLKTLESLKRKGAQITLLEVDSKGVFSLEELSRQIGSQTLLVGVLMAHNELGNIYPIQKIAEICRARGVYLHCDGVQAVGKIPLHLQKLGVDFFTFSAHKFHGPKGVGGLFVRRGVGLSALQYGGHQEGNLRGGTENLSGIYGMAVALETLMNPFEEDQKYISFLRNKLEKGFQERVSQIRINGDLKNRISNTLNVTVEGVDGESLLLNLDLEGIAASAGSACESGSMDPSHVMLALGLSALEAKASIRFSLSKYNTEEEVERVLKVFPEIVERLRK